MLMRAALKDNSAAAMTKNAMVKGECKKLRAEDELMRFICLQAVLAAEHVRTAYPGVHLCVISHYIL